MKLTVFLFAVFSVISVSIGNKFNCDPKLTSSDGPVAVCYLESCTTEIAQQVERELNAAFKYLYMAVYFDQDTVNRPGLAKFLYESASEEREHGILMMEYLNMRGVPFNESFEVHQKDLEKERSFTYEKTLQKALDMEVEVTNYIYKIIKACERDFHGADVFTDPILTEQHTGIRKINGLIKLYDDLALDYTDIDELELAEFIFDKKLEDGKI